MSKECLQLTMLIKMAGKPGWDNAVPTLCWQVSGGTCPNPTCAVTEKIKREGQPSSDSQILLMLHEDCRRRL